jgi:hypothetical protein
MYPLVLRLRDLFHHSQIRNRSCDLRRKIAGLFKMSKSSSPAPKKVSASSWLLPLCCRLLSVANVAVPASVLEIVDVSGIAAVLEDAVEGKVAELVIRHPEAAQALTVATAVSALANDLPASVPTSVTAAAQNVLEDVTKAVNELAPPAIGAPVPSPSLDTVVEEPTPQVVEPSSKDQ